MNVFMQKSKETEKKQEQLPFQGLNLIKKEEIKDVQQKQVVEQIAEINILKQEMLSQAKSFHDELDQLEHQLIKKSNQLQILTSQQMNEISQKNINLVNQFIDYQQSLIKKLEGKTSNWDHIGVQLNEVAVKVSRQMQEDDLPVKLARIEILEEEVQSLMSEIEQLNQENQKRKW